MLSGMFLLTLTLSSLSAQSLERQVIGSGGGTHYRSDSAVLLNFQTGETVVETMISGAFALTQGFEQPDSLQSASEVVDITYTFYPNPVTELAQLRIVSPVDVQLTLKITDLNGKVFWEKQIDLKAGAERTIRLPVQDLATGYYLLYFYDPSGREMHAVKWLKI